MVESVPCTWCAREAGSYCWRMRTIHSRARFLVAPALGTLFLLAWVLANHADIVDYVSLRSDTFATNPYVVMIAIGFALAVALGRVSPIAAFSVIGALLVIQALFWPARFSQVSWDAYLVLPFVALFAGAYVVGAGVAVGAWFIGRHVRLSA
jgi:hypothetical protein